MDVLQAKKRKILPGVVYLSYIPPFMNVKKVRELLSNFGEVRRIFLQPGKSLKPGKPSKHFTEGWVEFANKRVAKRVARSLNGTQVGGKRKSPYYDSLWSIKYLSKFRWAHLNERTAFEKARREQRMRAEIAQAKREANFYKNAYQKSKFFKKHWSKSASKDREASGEVESSDPNKDMDICRVSGEPPKEQSVVKTEEKSAEVIQDSDSKNRTADMFKMLFAGCSNG